MSIDIKVDISFNSGSPQYIAEVTANCIERCCCEDFNSRMYNQYTLFWVCVSPIQLTTAAKYLYKVDILYLRLCNCLYNVIFRIVKTACYPNFLQMLVTIFCFFFFWVSARFTWKGEVWFFWMSATFYCGSYRGILISLSKFNFAHMTLN